jgi:hypothetical protein
MAADPQSPFTVNDQFDMRTMMARWTETRRKAAYAFLDFYERTIGQIAEAHVKSARASDNQTVITIAERQAEMGRDVAGAYVSAARKMLDE